MQKQDTLDVTQGVTLDVDHPVVVLKPQSEQGNAEGLLQEPLTAQTHRPWTENMQVMEQSDADRPVVGVTP